MDVLIDLKPLKIDTGFYAAKADPVRFGTCRKPYNSLVVKSFFQLCFNSESSIHTPVNAVPFALIHAFIDESSTAQLWHYAACFCCRILNTKARSSCNP